MILFSYQSLFVVSVIVWGGHGPLWPPPQCWCLFTVYIYISRRIILSRLNAIYWCSIVWAKCSTQSSQKPSEFCRGEIFGKKRTSALSPIQPVKRLKQLCYTSYTHIPGIWNNRLIVGSNSCQVTSPILFVPCGT